MQESSDFLYHWTKEFKHLVNILQEGFKPFYCLESVDYLDWEALAKEINGESISENFTNAYPMVCFTDIPKERISKHQKQYGNYAIALTKNWGIKKGLAPVTYLGTDFFTSKWILRNWIRLQYQYVESERKVYGDDEKKFSKEYQIHRNILAYQMMFTKPYQGYLYDKKSDAFTDDIIRFYDEKEWRFIPLFEESDISLSLQKKDLNSEKRRENERRLHEKYKLDFVFQDIVEIIVPNKQEKEQLVKILLKKYEETQQSIEDKIRVNTVNQ